MVKPLIVATIMVLLTVIMHGGGLILLSKLLRLEREEERVSATSPLSVQGLTVTMAVVLGLFALHGVEIWLYAALYLLVEALPNLHEAVYFSTITYATIGYDDEGLLPAWRLVAAIEGVSGVLLLGWSTAFFVSFATRLRKR